MLIKVKEDLNKWSVVPCESVESSDILTCQISILIHRFNAIPKYQLAVSKIGRLTRNFFVEMKKAYNSQNNFEIEQ